MASVTDLFSNPQIILNPQVDINISDSGNTTTEEGGGELKGLAGKLIRDAIAIGVSYIFTFIIQDLMYYDWNVKRALEHCWRFLLGPALYLFKFVDHEAQKILTKFIDWIKSNITISGILSHL